jgi:signal transduction histidine kinase
MSQKEHAASDLAFLFKMAPLMRELDTVDRVYRLLLAMATGGRNVGFAKALLFIVDERNEVIRGRFGTERDTDERPAESFDDRAKQVFSAYENVEGTDLTVKARSFSVPLAWHKSGLVKAARTAHPVLAEKQFSEFATDTVFDYFELKRYLAVPVKLNKRVSAVVVVDMSGHKSDRSVESVSLLYSLTQQGAAAAQALLHDASHKRRARIVWKLQQSMQHAVTADKLDEVLRLAAIMVSRAIGSSGCVIKDFVRQKSIHVKTIHEHSPDATEDDSAISDCLASILDHAAGTMQSIAGDSSHAMLSSVAARHVDRFYATPLIAGDDIAGALAVYAESPPDHTGAGEYSGDDRHFVSLCAGIIASRLEQYQLDSRIQRAEDFNGEISSNLARERERSRRAEGSFQYQLDVADDLKSLRDILSTKTPYKQRFPQIVKVVNKMQQAVKQHLLELKAPVTRYEMVDLYDIVRRAAEDAMDKFVEIGVEVSTRIPPSGVELLMDKKSIAIALKHIINATQSYLSKGDKMLIECSSGEDNVVVCVADNGAGLPGDAITRLFMPFEKVDIDDEQKHALSLAGEIIEKHAGEIHVKSSMSWRTILALTFPQAANRDRRRMERDRRRRSERRLEISP